MRTPGIWLLISLCFITWPVQADQLPPLGKRIYVLDEEKPARPADIRPLERGSSVPGQTMMRDPLFLGAAEFVDKNSHRPTNAPKRVSRMTFDKVSVQGRYLVPRVTFDRPSMDVGRQEEPVKAEYRKKILDSERELREFDW
ncbi:MAG TPA: hypothetical protein VE954_34695 [Oligoflexus sp.]|uniref:hypothetical protein n=1 Tax=Oligoflexus sp. TaxID=1971216 RepID=UPI002D75FD72|nr:hypothetical protein [Oligoflexus sp.]HYX38280.1 hypothetical protein [Oligoflexus sp.]